jgi:hypothetical protein
MGLTSFYSAGALVINLSDNIITYLDNKINIKDNFFLKYVYNPLFAAILEDKKFYIFFMPTHWHTS